MAYGDIIIAIPGVSPPIPALTIRRFRADGGYRRSQVGFVGLSGRSNWGTAAISGPAYNPTFSWSIAAMLTEAEASQLEALALWQDSTFKSGGDGKLSLTDEIEYLPPEPNPHSRVLLTPLTPIWSSDYRYGYGVFDVLLTLAEDGKTSVGQWQDDGSHAKYLSFVAVEV